MESKRRVRLRASSATAQSIGGLDADCLMLDLMQKYNENPFVRLRALTSKEPQLRDPGDEMVLETAVNGHADALVTFNVRDFGTAPARFGIEVMIPREAIGRMKR
jgi:predicted nucleic acid-binding protein